MSSPPPEENSQAGQGTLQQVVPSQPIFTHIQDNRVHLPQELSPSLPLRPNVQTSTGDRHCIGLGRHEGSSLVPFFPFSSPGLVCRISPAEYLPGSFKSEGTRLAFGRNLVYRGIAGPSQVEVPLYNIDHQGGQRGIAESLVKLSGAGESSHRSTPASDVSLILFVA